jgi:ABC-type molybdate transport system substrate-binding protein
MFILHFWNYVVKFSATLQMQTNLNTLLQIGTETSLNIAIDDFWLIAVLASGYESWIEQFSLNEALLRIK